MPLRIQNLLILRSMTKDYALAGLRPGYAIRNQSIISALSKTRPLWSVNAFAQAAELAALEDERHLEESLAKLMQAKQNLETELRKLGLTPLPSQTHFFLLYVGDGKGFRRKLLEKGILVRDCASF